MFSKQQFASVEAANLWATERGNELALSLNTKIFPICFVEGEEPLDIAIGFLKTPLRAIKMQAIDMMGNMGHMQAGQFLLNACLIKEESDPRIWSESPDCDAINMGAVLSATKVIELRIDTKKK